MADNYNDFFKKNTNYNSNGTIEYYEDTHDKNGVYRPLPPGFVGFDSQKPTKSIASKANSNLSNFYGNDINANYYNGIHSTSFGSAMPLPNDTQTIVPRNYQNVVVYEPKCPEEVQSLINFLKRKEPAIVDLNKVDIAVAQRILDYLSGAIYALNGDVFKINSNIFLLSPEGVTVSTPLK